VGAAVAVQEALTRAMAGGQLRGIQLNTVLQRGTVIASLLAEELGGKGPQSLRRFAAEGKITSDVILQTLVKNWTRCVRKPTRCRRRSRTRWSRAWALRSRCSSAELTKLSVRQVHWPRR
jgi:tape measure domain-containing protein